MDQQEKFNSMCKRIKQLSYLGMSQKAIVKVINDLELPIDIHMALMGSLSEFLEIRENIESSIMEMFSRFSYKNSYRTGNAKTAHYEDGWVSNKSWKINHKIIIPREYLRTYQQMELIRDIELVLNYFAGKTADGFDKEWSDGRCNFEYFTLKFYSKTIHVVFKDLDLLKRWNIYCWMKLGMLPSTYSDMQPEEKEMIYILLDEIGYVTEYI